MYILDIVENLVWGKIRLATDSKELLSVMQVQNSLNQYQVQFVYILNALDPIPRQQKLGRGPASVSITMVMFDCGVSLSCDLPIF